MSQIHHFRDYIFKDNQLFELLQISLAQAWLRVLRITSVNIQSRSLHLMYQHIVPGHTYCARENFGGKIGKFGESWASYLPNFSSPIVTDTSKMYLAYALTVAYSPNFSSPIAFTRMGHQNFSLLNISRLHTEYIEIIVSLECSGDHFREYLSGCS